MFFMFMLIFLHFLQPSSQETHKVKNPLAGGRRQMCRNTEPKCDVELFCSRGVCTPEVEYNGRKNRDIVFQSKGEKGLIEGAMCGPDIRLLGGKCKEELKCVRVNRYYGICQNDEGQAIEIPELLGPGLVEGAMCGPNVRLLGGKCEKGLKCVDVGEYYGICKKEDDQKITEDKKGCPPSPGRRPSAVDIDALDRYMRGWSRGNLTIMETVLDESFTFTMTGQGDPVIIMRNGFTNFVKQFMKTIEDGGGPTVTYTSPLMTFTNVIRRQTVSTLVESAMLEIPGFKNGHYVVTACGGKVIFQEMALFL